jgi:hypothetical protein
MFEIGDKVVAFGNEGVVHSISSNGMFLHVKFKEFESLVVFNIDGRLFKWNKKPTLKKVKSKK